jgi:opacity protein-like surface antigen
MKQLTIVLLSLFLLTAAVAPAFAQRSGGQLELGGSLGYATGPGSFDDDWGVTFGAGYMLNNIENFQARIDLSYFPFERDVLLGTSLEFTRVPIAVGGRYYVPVTDTVNFFAEGAIEASFDDAEFIGVFGTKHTDDEVNFGFTPGAGAEFFVSDMISLFTTARYHMITDDYLSIHLGGAFHF